MTTNCDYLNQITKIRLFLKQDIYSRQEIIEQITQEIYNCFEVFTVNYEPTYQSIKIKIKITNMKKRYPNYEHDSMYYYNIMNNIIVKVLSSNINFIREVYNCRRFEYDFDEVQLLNLLNISHISGLYNITTLLDNIIIINL